MTSSLTQAIPVAVEKFADCGPGNWWFVHHPDGFLIECAIQRRAEQIAAEINAGRSILFPSVGSTGANMEQCDVESSAVKVGATNSPDGAAISASSGRPEGGKRLQVTRGPNFAAEPDGCDPETSADDGRDVEATGGTASVITNSHQREGNGIALPVETATEKQADCASRPNNSNSQVFSEPANAGEIDPSQASPAPHSTGATVDKTGRAGECPSAPVTLSKADMVRLLRPHCQHPGADLCAGSGRSHCHACRGNSEVAA